MIFCVEDDKNINELIIYALQYYNITEIQYPSQGEITY